MFKYSYKNKMGECEGSCDNRANTPTHTNIISKFSESSLIRRVILTKEDEFGLYEVEILHEINGSKLETNIISFTPHKETHNKE